MQLITTEAEHTSAHWQEMIDTFNQKVRAFASKITEMTGERATLVLDAELNRNGAGKRLEKLDEQIAAIQRQANTTREAIQQAQKRLAEAREVEAAVAERVQRAKLGTLAATVLEHATEVDQALQQATKAGAALKLVIHNMIALSTPVERQSLNQLLEPGAFMRAAEHAGLRACIEIPAYPGLREHITSLEDSMAVQLARWLEQEKK